MKFPYNPNYEKMKLPYSSSEFPSSLTGTVDNRPSTIPKWYYELGTADTVGGEIPPYAFKTGGFYTPFGFNPLPIFMLWPSSWRYPDGCDPFLT